MKTTKSKSIAILDMLKAYRGSVGTVIEDYTKIIKDTDELVTLSYTDKCISILAGDFNYLYIYPDNTVTCNEDGWGMSMHFEVNIFTTAMHL